MAFTAHHVRYVYRFAIAPVEYSTRWFDDLPVAPAAEFGSFRAAVWVSDQMIYVPEYPPHQFTSGGGIVERDVVGDGVEVV